MDYRCIGCGAILQTENENEKGFISEDVFKRLQKDTICKRCFSLSHYGENIECKIDSDEYLRLIQSIQKKDVLVIALVDIFDFYGTFISSIKRHTGQDDIILVGNKRDLIPHSVKLNKITNWMRHMAKNEGLSVLDACVISAKTGDGIDPFMDLVDKYRHGRDVYIVGMTNVGKSTLINTIIKKYTDAKKDVITTSNIPGTTLDFIEIPYENSFIVDTPGIINLKQVYNLLSLEENKLITPKKEIKPRVYQLDDEQCVFISGIAILKFIKGEHSNFVFYFGDNVNIHRTKMSNYDRIKESIGTFLVPPFVKQDYTTTLFKINDDGKKYDIVIAGLGFVTVKGKLIIQMEAINGVGVSLRESII